MIKYNIEKFPVGAVSKALARQGGAHIYSLTCAEEEVPNGVFVGRGTFVELDHYTVTAAGNVTGKVQCKLANGNYLVEIDECDEDTLFVANVALIEEQYNRSFQNEGNFINAKNSELRAYQLRHGDTVELNKAALGLTAEPASYPMAVTAATYGSSSFAKAFAVVEE